MMVDSMFWDIFVFVFCGILALGLGFFILYFLWHREYEEGDKK